MDYYEESKEARRNILKIVHASRGGHIGSALSCVDLLIVLYFKILKIDPKDPLAEGRDRFILSKGHAVAALDVVLAQRGFFSKEILETYCKDGSKLAGHSTKGSVPGMEVSTGALGHGLSMGAGIALAAKNDNKDYRVFVLMSDGECEEGSVWEAALFSSQHKLDNLIGIIDYNKIQAFGRTNDILNLEPFSKKWQDFGWAVKEINGHDFSEIEEAFSNVPFEKGRPSLVIANTIKGKGISFLEDRLISHYKHFTEEEYRRALKELK